MNFSPPIDRNRGRFEVPRMRTIEFAFRRRFGIGGRICTLAMSMLLLGASSETPQPRPLDLPATIELFSNDLPVPLRQEPPDNDPLNAHRILWMEVTAYCPCTICCGKGAMGLTASGKHVSYNEGQFVAADTDVLPFGTKLLIPGYADEQTIEVIDRGGAIKGHKLDVFFASHQQAMEWGRQWIPVTVVDGL